MDITTKKLLRKESDRPKAFHELPIFKKVSGHTRSVPFYITEEMIKNLGFDVAAVELSSIIDKPIAEMHSHDTAELYLLLSPEKGEAIIRIEIESETHELCSPGVFYIPPKTMHRFIAVKAVKGSFCIGILLNSLT